MGRLRSLPFLSPALERAGARFRRSEVPRAVGATKAQLGAPKHVAVVGGGIAGLAAATVLTERGARVTLIERESFLGGRAGSWPDRHDTGHAFEMERGFHAFFRQYYNLRALLERVDPGLTKLRPLDDYPLLGPGGTQESFSKLPTLPPLNVAALVTRTDALTLRDLTRVDAKSAMEMLRFDPRRTYAAHDRRTAREYLDSLRFPADARQRLFDVFAHSFFNPEDDYSAAELLMNFHFYFMGNPEGLVFDVATEPFGRAFWEPLGRRLEAAGAALHRNTTVLTVKRDREGFALQTTGGEVTADALVLALDVPGLKAVVESSPTLGDGPWRRRVLGLGVTHPFVVWRHWLDRPVRADRPAFAGTTGEGLLDNISVYEKLEDESRAWASERRGSVVELHAYAVPPEATEREVREDLLRALHAFYPETRPARIVAERYLVRRDCPAFRPGEAEDRPGVRTPDPGLKLAGDFAKTDFPSALMEKAAATGFLAANELLEEEGVRGEAIYSVPPRGLLAFG